MEMVDYPQEIAEASRLYLAADQQVRQLEQDLERLKWEITNKVAFDSTLKNQNQRDCRKVEILNASSQYQAFLSDLQIARHERSLLNIKLRYLRDRFSSLQLSVLAKLEFLSRSETRDDIRIHLAGLGLQGLFSGYSGVRAITPTDAANEIFSFVEALLTRSREEPITDELWIQKMSTPEFYPEESEDTEFEDKSED